MSAPPPLPPRPYGAPVNRRVPPPLPARPSGPANPQINNNALEPPLSGQQWVSAPPPPPPPPLPKSSWGSRVVRKGMTVIVVQYT